MKIEFREVKSVITKSAIPGVDYVCNPYTGCQHGCIYCYAVFMKRFTGHGGDIWGEFLDIKQGCFNSIFPKKYRGKTIMLSSVTDPYTPSEKTYRNTRQILEKLQGTEATVEILTKSRFFSRDIDLFQGIKNIRVGVSLNTLDPNIARKLEPKAANPLHRLDSLKKVADAGIKTWAFISPIFPHITDWQAIIEASENFTDDYLFENLNYRGHNIQPIMDFISANFPSLRSFYGRLKKESAYWEDLDRIITEYGKNRGIKTKIAFHHGGFTIKKQG